MTHSVDRVLRDVLRDAVESGPVSAVSAVSAGNRDGNIYEIGFGPGIPGPVGDTH
ncbi:MAG: hypothetical protein ABSB01_27315 [Streptosporangiaceae bacterium]|jgi:hypothetical protein